MMQQPSNSLLNKYENLINPVFSSERSTENSYNSDCEFVHSLYITGISVDPTAKFVASGGRRLTIFRFDDLREQKALQTPHQCYIGTAHWNPHFSSANLIATGSTSFVYEKYKTTIWNLDVEKLTTSYNINSYSVADMRWSVFDPNVIATCGTNGITQLWDLRDTKSPKRAFTHGSHGSTILRWNRAMQGIFATAQDRIVNIWDMRKESSAPITITAHVAPISAIDWSYTCSTEILTGAQDKQIKFWDINKPRSYKDVMHIGGAVASALYTPFGKAVVTATVGTVSSVNLWNLQNTSTPVHTFMGHKGTIRACEWRIKPESNIDEQEFQLVSASHKQLKSWAISSTIRKECSNTSLLNATRTTREYKPLELSQELALINKHGIPGVTFNEIDINKRSVVASIEHSGQTIQFQMTFPLLYPRNAPPSFSFYSTSLTDQAQANILRVLLATAIHNVEANVVCIDSCLSKLVLLLKHVPMSTLEKPRYLSSTQEGQELPPASLTETVAQLERQRSAEGILAYVVKSTDTLQGIALTHNMKPEQVRVLNGLVSDVLMPGQTLFLKGGALTPPLSEFRKKRKEDTQKRAKARTLDFGTTTKFPGGLTTVSTLLDGNKDSAKETSANGGNKDATSASSSIASKKSRSFSMVSHVSSDIIKETARYCTGGVQVCGVLTMTSEFLVFEPNANDPRVAARGILEYQIYLPMKDILDCQIIKDNPNCSYDDTLEISLYDNNKHSINIYDLALTHTKLRTVYMKLVTWISDKKANHCDENLPEQNSTEDLASKLNAFLPTLSEPSKLLTTEALELATELTGAQLNRYLPARYSMCDKWYLLYSTDKHGTSLSTFYSQTKDAGANLILIQDTNKHIFGAFANSSWTIDTRFYGNGECFVFSLTGQPQIYRWSGKGNLFMCSRKDFIAMGGGTKFALWFDSELKGCSGESPVFNNKCLASSSEFVISKIEVWGFKEPEVQEFSEYTTDTVLERFGNLAVR